MDFSRFSKILYILTYWLSRSTWTRVFREFRGFQAFHGFFRFFKLLKFFKILVNTWKIKILENQINHFRLVPLKRSRLLLSDAKSPNTCDPTSVWRVGSTRKEPPLKSFPREIRGENIRYCRAETYWCTTPQRMTLTRSMCAKRNTPSVAYEDAASFRPGSH